MFGLDYEVAEESLLGWSEMMPWKKKNKKKQHNVIQIKIQPCNDA